MAHKIQISVDVLLVLNFDLFLKSYRFWVLILHSKIDKGKKHFKKRESDISRSKIGGLVEYGS